MEKQVKYIFKKIPRFHPLLGCHRTIDIIKDIVFSSSDSKDLRGFEGEFSEYIGVDNAVTVPSGRIGLYLILKNLDLEKGAEVILPAYTYWVIPRIVSLLNLKPVFVDIDPDSYTMDPSLIEKKITSKTKVIIPTNLYGLYCDIEAIERVAKKHNLFIIEDCVQACGAKLKGRNLGSYGDAAFFSFCITKNLFLLGSGIVLLKDKILAEKIRKETEGYALIKKKDLLKKIVKVAIMYLLTMPFVFSVFLFPVIYVFSLFGIDVVTNIFAENQSFTIDDIVKNYKNIPPVIQASIGKKSLEGLQYLNESKLKNGMYLAEHLRSIPGVNVPIIKEGSIFITFPIRCKSRDALSKSLLQKGIDTTRGFISSFGEDCPNARKVEQEILHIPVYSSLTQKDLDYICSTIKDICADMNFIK